MTLGAASCSYDRSPTVEGRFDAAVTQRIVASKEAELRVATLRAQFVSGQTPAIAAGIAEGFEASAMGTTLVPVLPVGAKAAVARSASVQLPARANAPTLLEDDRSHLAIGFSLRGASEAPVEVAAGLALYRGASSTPGDGRDVIHRVHAEGTEDFVVFDRRPAREEVVYDVDVSRVAGLRLVSNTLELLDPSGTPRLRVAPPWVLDAQGVKHDARLAVDGCAYDNDPRGPWGRAVTAPGKATCAVRVSWSDVVYPALLDPAWTTTGSMSTPRTLHTATLLLNGKVHIGGGTSASDWSTGNALASAELYDPAGSGTFAATGWGGIARHTHTATLLASGKVLLAGGLCRPPAANAALVASIAFVYDPSTGTSTDVGPMSSARMNHTATLLSSGKVLLAGGETDLGLFGNLTLTSTAEIFDPSNNSFVATESLKGGIRSRHTATLLGSGKVLVGGGYAGIVTPRATGELFDPSGAGTFTLTGSMVTGRYGHTASRLASGKVLIAGGGDGNAVLSSAELFDPTAGGFTGTAAMATTRTTHAAEVLPTGAVLVVGGVVASTGAAMNSASLFDPAGAGSFTSPGNMATGRYSFTATTLVSGKVLVVGGRDGNTTVSSTAELFNLIPGTTCSAGSDCGSGVCKTHCCSAACSPSACQDAPCDTAGACVYAPKAAGTDCGASGYTCNGTGATCPTSCTTDAGCATTHFCSSGSCVAKKASGATCATGARECANGFCVDGFCCNGACTGNCQACAASLTNGANGTCTNTKDGIDPRNNCGTPTCAGNTLTANVCNGVGSCRTLTSSCPNGCAGTTCASSCSTDGVCGATGYCSGGNCAPKQASGSGCTATNQCLSGHCVDGVCCTSACTGPCEACNEPTKAGSCAPVTGAPRPNHGTCNGTGTSCAGTCDGTNTAFCGYPNVGSVCGAGCTGSSLAVCSNSGSCLAPVACPGNMACASAAACRTTCVGDQECAAGAYCTAGSCATKKANGSACGASTECRNAQCVASVCCATACSSGYTCQADGSACKTTCASDGDCIASSYCLSGACTPRKANGTACTAGSECGSGNCVDAVCCDKACVGSCVSCLATQTGIAGSDGTCNFVKDGNDPTGDCGTPTCAGSELTTNVCNGLGVCRAATLSCAPFACNAAGNACAKDCTTDSDCGVSGYCGSDAKCAGKKARGTACSGNNQCTSGACADGVCCDRACSGQCEACAEPSSNGTCVAVVGQPRMPRTTCAGGGGDCGGRCDGNNAAVCKYPTAGTSCGDGCKSASIAVCDGAGVCLASAACAGNLACADATQCRTACTANGDCAATYVCTGGLCAAAPSAKCSDDGMQSVPVGGGAPTSCAPYKCGTTGACLQACATSNDCATGANCDTSAGAGRCVQTGTDPGGGGDESGGCTFGKNGSVAVGGLAAIALLGLLARRRRALTS